MFTSDCERLLKIYTFFERKRKNLFVVQKILIFEYIFLSLALNTLILSAIFHRICMYIGITRESEKYFTHLYEYRTIQKVKKYWKGRKITQYYFSITNFSLLNNNKIVVVNSLPHIKKQFASLIESEFFFAILHKH